MPLPETVLFVGGFKSVSADGSYGGQVYACRSLIESPLKDSFHFILFDSTADTVKPPPVYQRFLRAITRLVKFMGLLSFRKINSVLIFSSGGFSFYEKGMMAIMAKLFGKRVVLAPRSGLIQQHVMSSKFFHRYLNFVFQKCDVIICQGMEWKMFFQRFTSVKETRLVVQPNWIDITKYSFAEKELHAKCRLLFIGQFHPYKGLHDLLEAMLLLNDIDYQLDVYGGGEARTSYEHFVQLNGLGEKIFFKGWANEDQKAIALKWADILVLPSHAEGMPNVILEAMASGVTVVATRVGGVPSLIEQGVTGLMVEPHAERQLSDNIRNLASHPEMRQQLSVQALAKIKRENSIEAMVNRFGKILNGYGEVN